MSNNQFEELRRMAQERGMSDYERFKAQREPGQPIWRNNPHQNNHATDEREYWDIGWDNAAELDEEAPHVCKWCGLTVHWEDLCQQPVSVCHHEC